MSDTIETHQITADELKALRSATDVSFHYREGRAFVSAAMQHDPGDGFGKRELRREIDGQFKATIYERDLSTGRKDPTSCFWGLTSARFSPEWKTALHFMRTGDELILHWTGADNTEALRSAGFQMDSFRLEIRRRRDGKAPLHFVFLLDVRAATTGVRDIRF